MKYKKLLILLTIATLSLTACGKEPAEVPTETAVEEISPEEPESEDTVTNADRGAAEGEIVDNKANNESTETDEHLINEPGTTALDESLKELEDAFKAGLISKEDYDAIMKEFNGGATKTEDAAVQAEIDRVTSLYESGEITKEEYDNYMSFLNDTPTDPIEFPEGEDTHVDVPFNYGTEDTTDWTGESDIDFNNTEGIPDWVKGKKFM